MGRTRLALAFIAWAGIAGAQTVNTAPHDTANTEAQTSTQANGGAIPDGAARARATPEIASAPIPMSDAARIARERIERDGYRDVRGLAIGPDGLWQGTALRGNTLVQVTVDRSGNVAAK
jgi:hypothetical protein